MIDAAFFDNFGVVAFVIVTVAAIRLLKRGRLSRPFSWVLLAVGVLGLAVDLTVVTTTYLFS
ncbi:MAG: hypothetical protein V1885_01445 [Candidatus Brennerbacteria bacterium]